MERGLDCWSFVCPLTPNLSLCKARPAVERCLPLGILHPTRQLQYVSVHAGKYKQLACRKGGGVFVASLTASSSIQASCRVARASRFHDQKCETPQTFSLFFFPPCATPCLALWRVGAFLMTNGRNVAGLADAGSAHREGGGEGEGEVGKRANPATDKGQPSLGGSKGGLAWEASWASKALGRAWLAPFLATSWRGDPTWRGSRLFGLWGRAWSVRFGEIRNVVPAWPLFGPREELGAQACDARMAIGADEGKSVGLCGCHD